MENSNPLTKKDIREQIHFFIDFVKLILLLAAIVSLIFGIITIIKYRDMLKEEPVKYLRERYRMVGCNCIDDEGTIWNSGEVGFLPKPSKPLLLFSLNYTS